jgi:hypothetical protein
MTDLRLPRMEEGSLSNLSKANSLFMKNLKELPDVAKKVNFLYIVKEYLKGLRISALSS